MRTPYRRFRFFVPLVILLALLAVSYAVLWLWNTVLVAVVPVKPVTFWQAVGLLILSRLLFGGFRFGPRGGGFRNAGADGGPAWREKWRQLSDEDRSKLRSEWRKRCRPKSEL